MDIYSIKHFINIDDVDLHLKIKTSSLFSIMQQSVSIHHIDQGVSSETMISNGYLWIITSQYAQFVRKPKYRETITIETWCGKQLQVLYPRYFRVIDENNNVIVRSSSIWAVMNAETRKLAMPYDTGIFIDGISTGNETPLPVTPVTRDSDYVRDFTVPYSCIDFNGHMNNTKYFDVVEDSITPSYEGKELKELTIEYRNECRYGQKIQIYENHTDDDYFIIGKSDKEIFRVNLKY